MRAADRKPFVGKTRRVFRQSKAPPAGCFFACQKIKIVGADAYIGPPHRTTCYPPVGGGGCPPSCQPIPGHCCGRQSGHFLEISSLLPPLAALRRFPRRPAFAHLHVMRRAGCPQPAARQPPPPGRARGPCPTKKYHCRAGSMCPRTSCKKQKTAQRFTLHGYFSDTASSRP